MTWDPGNFEVNHIMRSGHQGLPLMPGNMEVRCVLNLILFFMELFDSCMDMVKKVVGGLGLLICEHLDGCLVVETYENRGNEFAGE